MGWGDAGRSRARQDGGEGRKIRSGGQGRAREGEEGFSRVVEDLVAQPDVEMVEWCSFGRWVASSRIFSLSFLFGRSFGGPLIRRSFNEDDDFSPALRAPPGGNQVDGLPPVSIIRCQRNLEK